MIEPLLFSMCAQRRENFVVYRISYSLPNLVFLNIMRFISTTRAHAMRPYGVLLLTDLRLTDLQTYRLTDLQTYRLTDLQTYRLTDLRLTDYLPYQIPRNHHLLHFAGAFADGE